MSSTERVRPIRVDFQYTPSGLTCDSTCTEPCSSFQEVILSSHHTVRIYRHKTHFGFSYIFTSSDDSVWVKPDKAWYTIRLLDVAKETTLLELELDGVFFDCTLDENGLQLLVGGRHNIESTNDPKGPRKIRFTAIYKRHALGSHSGEQQKPNRLSGNHFESFAMVFFSTLVLYHLLNSRQLLTNHEWMHYETVFVTFIQCMISILFLMFHSIAFSPLFYRGIYGSMMDCITFLFLASDGIAIYFITILSDWLMIILQQISFWLCIKICVERKQSGF